MTSNCPATNVSLASRILAAVKSVAGSGRSFVPLHEPEFAGNEWLYVKECIDTGWVSSVGSFVDRFEKDLSKITGAAHVIATANGTAALHTCLMLSGVQRGDEVLVPALTFVATANAVSYAGGTPHFVDSEPTSLGVDANKLDAYLQDIATVQETQCINRKTGAVIRALVVVHIFGHPADMHSLLEVARRWKLILIEDAAESLGSYVKGVHTGNAGLLAALSFNGNKIVTTGGGGAILTNDPELGRRAKHLTTTARVSHRWSFVHDEIGYNYRLPNLNAALGCAQLERLPSMVQRKRALASAYASAFRSIEEVQFLYEPPDTSSNYWLNALLLDRQHATQRDDVLTALNDAGFMSRPTWTLMHQLPMYASAPRMDLSSAEDLASRVINVPSSPVLSEAI